MTPYEVVGVALRQALGQHLEAAAAVARARHHHLAVDGYAPLVLGRRHEPGRVRVARVSGHREAELRGADRAHLTPGGAGVLRAEHAVMVLAPHHLRARRAARQPVHVLRDRILAQLRRHVLGIHAAVDEAPAGALVAARPHARGRDADADVPGIARIHEHRADARLLAAGDAVPLAAVGHTPERLVQRPGLAAVVGAEEAAGHGAGPDPPGNAAGLEHPDLAERPGMRVFVAVRLGLRRKHRRRHLAPL